MASTSASLVQKSFKYDVFLSFRGEDTRKNFVDHLYHALHQKGIITYKDDERIEKGERISDQLTRSIEESRFYIIVFSKNYASSSWCLDELVKIMECQNTMERTAYPIFFDVEPTEVRHQTGVVGEAFQKFVGKGKGKRKLEDWENEDDVRRWRSVLKDAASLAGMDLKTTFNGQEAKLIQQIVQEISLKLQFINQSIDGKLVGMKTRVKNVVSSLETGSDDVCIIGIKGIGGGGKTTLARAVFDDISKWFDGKSFVENVREVSKGCGLKELQKQILQDVLGDENILVKCVSEGKSMMKRMLPSRKALVVLDDVDDINQLEALAGELNWFKSGSRIIITTRDEQVLIAQRVKFIHDVNLLSNEEATGLLSRHAFAREIPIEGYEDLSEKVVHYAAGLPLTIKVLGSHLCGRSVNEWIDVIERLKTIPEDQTLKRLEISYNGLENDQKDIFLDIVCILKGETKDEAIRILESCGFNAQIGLRVLEQKSLITISEDYGLRFHDHIEELGWNIVRRMHPDEPRRHTRLWIKKEIEDILVNESGTKETKCVKLELSNLHLTIIMNGLRKMKKLRFLYVQSVYQACEVDEVTQHLPDALRSLCWHHYPFKSFPETFRANKPLDLEMNSSNITRLSEGRERKVLNKLKLLHLRNSSVTNINLGMTPHLESLYLTRCKNFERLYLPIECTNLKFLDLSHSKVSNLNIGMTPHLEDLRLIGCTEFVELHMSAECPKLKFLNLSGSKVINLNLGLTPNLIRLNLRRCHSLQEIHAPRGSLKKVVFLNMDFSSRFKYFQVDKQHKSASLDSVAILELTVVSVDVCPLHPSNNLPKFGLKCKYDELGSSWSGNLGRLISFGPCVCKNIKSFLTSICSLQHLREVTLKGCIPRYQWQSESLKKLSLKMEEIQHLPDSIYNLKHLKHLQLQSCWRLEQLSEDICRFKFLEELHIIDCRSLLDIPNSICKMKCLKGLHLAYCLQVKKLPEALGCLECLKVLNIDATGISHLPLSIFQLKGLRVIGSREQLQSYGFKSFIEILSRSREWCYIDL